MTRSGPVVVVEDDETWTALVRRHVEQCGAQVVLATHAGQAMLAIEQTAPRLIILDMLLIGETGMTLLNELRSHSDLRQIPVIVLSSALNDAAARALEAYDVYAVLDKTTATPTRLASVIRGALDG